MPVCMQSPDSAKNKEELSRLYKRLRAGRKSVEEKQKKCLEQKEKVAKLDKDLESITDGELALLASPLAASPQEGRSVEAMQDTSSGRLSDGHVRVLT